MIDGGMLMVGCGNMGGAMLRRWLASGLQAEQVTVVSPSGRTMPPGVTVVRDVPPASAFDVIVLALKPQQLASLADTPLGSQVSPLLVSLLAGVTEDALVRICPARAVVRAMPNLPVALGRGVTALHGRSGDPRSRAVVDSLMRPLGQVEWIGDEALFDAVTALSGCGPAFVFRFVDALARAGMDLGLPGDQAMRLALATVDGAAAMALAAEATPGELADRVASPGGSTREGLNVLDQDEALAALMRRTLAAAARRNAELAALVG